MNRSPLHSPKKRDPVLWSILWLGVALLAILVLAIGCLASIGSPGGQTVIGPSVLTSTAPTSL